MADRVQYLLDRMAVEDVVRQYGRACDASDRELIRTTFTEDARATFGGGEPLVGADAIVDWLMVRGGDTLFSQHIIAPQYVGLDGGEAECSAQLVARQSFARDPDTRLLTAGTYHLRLRRVPGQWRISELELVVGWVERTDASATR